MKFYIALFVAVLTLALLGALPARAETEPPYIPEPRNPAYIIAERSDAEPERSIYPAIVGGVISEPNEWPWQVFVLVHHAELSPTSYVFCGGSLIAQEWVLTAAHCMTKKNTSTLTFMQASDVRVRVGEHNIYLADDTEQVFSASQVLPHPNYNPYTSDNDIVLLHLSHAAQLGATAAIIPLLTSPGDDPLAAPNSAAMTTGWGATGTYDAPSPELREVDVPIVANPICDKIFANDITSNMICAGYGPNGPDKDSCYGDSGGPLVVSDGAGGWKLVGVTSFGPHDCATAYGVYTRVSKYAEWISGIVDASSTTALSLDSFAPASGVAGAEVSIFGLGFTGVQQVLFDSVPAEFTVQSDTAISATVPGNGTTGVIQLVGPSKTVESATPFRMAYPLTLAVTGEGAGSVTSFPAGIDCGSTCSHEFDVDATVNLTAVADSGSVFNGWIGACTGMNRTCVLTADATKTAIARFERDQVFLPSMYARPAVTQ